MKILSWNINSLRLRMPSLLKLIKEYQPDIVCLQETKVQDSHFPLEQIQNFGYNHVYFKGMKSYNGVCIFSLHPFIISNKDLYWCDKNDCRHVSIEFNLQNQTFHLHNFYVPAGGDIPDVGLNPKFKHKLDFLDEVTHWFNHKLDKNTILVGDLNIAPLEQDVWSHKQLLNIVSHTPIETKKLIEWMEVGFIDAIREIIPIPEKIYTWWSYRNKDWSKSNRGRRLDHIWVSRDLKSHIKSINILKEARDWDKPSDHVPVILELDLKSISNFNDK